MNPYGLMDFEMTMATTHQLESALSSVCAVSSPTTTSLGAVKIEGTNNDQFPAGLRVLVVDDDPICLLILDRLLRQCNYEVTTCGMATTALKMLRESRDKYDVVLSDVVMPDMDGFKLLELVGLEMDLPVIMMSANGETSAVMKGITHGACDYLLKPVRIEELRNIWQHVVRRRRDSELSPTSREERHKRGTQDVDHNSSANDCLDGTWRLSKKKKDIKDEEEDTEPDNEDPSGTKKPRVVWSVDLHQQFVSAVNQLGIDKAVPKRILELMNVQGLTRENVASHLQKYRLYLKRISGVAHQSGGMSASFAGGPDVPFNVVSGGGLGGLGELRSLVATGQLSPQALMSALQTGLLGRLGTSNNLGMAGVDPSLLLQLAGMQGASGGGLIRQPYGQSLLNDGPGKLHQALSSGLDLKQLAQSSQPVVPFGQLGAPMEKGQTGISTLQQVAATDGLGGVGQLAGVRSNAPVTSNNNALMMQMLQQQAGAQLPNAGVINLPSGGPLGQHMLSNDIGGMRATLPLSTNFNTGSGVGVSGVGQARTDHGSHLGSASTSSSSILNTLGRTLSSDTKVLHPPNVGHGTISSTPTGFDSELGTTGVKAVGPTFVGINDFIPSSVRRMGSNLNSLMGLNHGVSVDVSTNNRQGWQGLSMGQEAGQICTTPVLSPRFGQPVSSGKGLNMSSSGQEQGKGHSPGFTGQSMNFLGNPAVDTCWLKPSVNIESQNKRSMVDSELKGKDATLDLLVGSKEASGFLPDPFSSSDDLLSLFFKQIGIFLCDVQQQGGLGFTEADLAADGYSALGNMSVK